MVNLREGGKERPTRTLTFGARGRGNRDSGGDEAEEFGGHGRGRGGLAGGADWGTKALKVSSTRALRV